MALLREQDKAFKTPEDICAHLGEDYDKYYGATNPPIYQSSLFSETTEPNPYGYTRYSNPTTDVAELKIAALEGTEGALCFSSGMAAITSAILHYIKPNCHVVMVRTAYPPAVSFLRYLGERFAVTHTLVDGGTQEIIDATRDNTTLIYLESPSSAVYHMQDLDAIAAFAKSRGIGTAIDNSYATPLFQNPHAHGVDIVCHTASKYLGGHSDLVCGAIAADADIIQSIQGSERALLGGNMDPHQSWLLIRGMRTLPERMRGHARNAIQIANFLENHPKIAKVYYPSLPSYEDRVLYEKYMTGANGLMSFVIDGTADDARRMMNACHFFRRGCSWGGFESLIIGRSVGTPPDQCKAEGLPMNLIRIHVGLESPQSLIEDLDNALRAM